jgi:hypothetical protein
MDEQRRQPVGITQKSAQKYTQTKGCFKQLNYHDNDISCRKYSHHQEPDT